MSNSSEKKGIQSNINLNDLSKSDKPEIVDIDKINFKSEKELIKKDNSPKTRNIKVFLTLSFLLHFSGSAWDVIFPDLVIRIGGTVEMWGWAYAAYNITHFLFEIPNATLSDRFGRKKIIIFAMIVYGIGSSIALWQSNPLSLIIARALQGAGAVSAVILAGITDNMAIHNRGKVVARRNLTQVVGWILGMIIGGLLAEFWSLNASIYLCIILGFGSAIYASHKLIEYKKSTDKINKKEKGKKEDKKEENNWKDEKNKKDKIRKRKEKIKISKDKELKFVSKYINNHPYAYGLIFGSIRYLLYQAIMGYIMWYLAEIWGYSSFKRSLILLPVIVFYILALVITGKLPQKNVFLSTLVILGFLALALVSYGFFWIQPKNGLFILIIILITLSLTLGTIHTSLTSIMVSDLEEKNRGIALGFAMTAQYGMIILSPIIMSSAATNWGPDMPFMVVSVMAFITAGIAWILQKKWFGTLQDELKKQMQDKIENK